MKQLYLSYIPSISHLQVKITTAMVFGVVILSSPTLQVKLLMLPFKVISHIPFIMPVMQHLTQWLADAIL